MSVSVGVCGVSPSTNQLRSKRIAIVALSGCCRVGVGQDAAFVVAAAVAAVVAVGAFLTAQTNSGQRTFVGYGS